MVERSRVAWDALAIRAMSAECEGIFGSAAHKVLGFVLKKIKSEANEGLPVSCVVCEVSSNRCERQNLTHGVQLKDNVPVLSSQTCLVCVRCSMFDVR